MNDFFMIMGKYVMMRDRSFRIKSKKDAEDIADEIRRGNNFCYFLPLMGKNGGTITIHWDNGTERYTVSAMCPGWVRKENASPCDIINYIWKDRKMINDHFRNIEAQTNETA
ncbi:MAG: hypothetical protein JW736_08030 [Deltaproteobacteria bacterium]|nr:hypothetical protein [Deltaproteobacteria bacterium]